MQNPSAPWVALGLHSSRIKVVWQLDLPCWVNALCMAALFHCAWIKQEDISAKIRRESHLKELHTVIPGASVDGVASWEKQECRKCQLIDGVVFRMPWYCRRLALSKRPGNPNCRQQLLQGVCLEGSQWESSCAIAKSWNYPKTSVLSDQIIQSEFVRIQTLSTRS